MKNKMQAMLAGMTVICLILLLSGGSVQGTPAMKYPKRPVEVLVPWSAGSTLDVVTRLIADMGPKYLGQPMVVINKLGAQGSVAAAELLSSKADGYKLLMSSNWFPAVLVKTPKVPFNADDLDPLAFFYAWKLGVYVRADSPWKTVKDMVEYARENPNKLKVGLGSPGTGVHVGYLETFKGTKPTEIFLKGGGAEMLPALLGGHIDVAFGVSHLIMKSQVQTGRIRILAVTNDVRYSDLPDVPSLVDFGVRKKVAGICGPTNGLYIHKKAPEEIKRVLVDVCKKVYEDPEFKKGVEKIGEELKFGGPEDFKRIIEDAREVGIPLIKELGLYVE